MSSLDPAFSVVRGATGMIHALAREPVGEVASDVAAANVAEQSGSMAQPLGVRLLIRFKTDGS